MIQFKNKDICVFESALFRTTSTVLETPDLVLIVDPTWLPEEIAVIRHWVDAIKRERPLYLLFTHSDYDHILGFGAFLDAKIIASRAFVENPNKATPLQAIRKFDHEYYIRRPYEMVYPKVDVIIEPDIDFITIGDTRLSFWPAPGHNADGIFTLVEPLGVWISGDYLSNEEFPFIYHSSVDYLKTLDTAEQIIKDRQPTYMVPGHGDVCTELSEMISRLKESREYILTLQDCLQKGKDFPEEALWKRYAFKGVQEKFHRDNITLMKKEMQVGNGPR